MDRASIEKALRDACAARMRGDLEALCERFSDDALFAQAGSPETSPIAMRATDRDGIREALSGLIAAVDFVEHEILSLIVEGDRAAVHARIRVRATATGEEAVTETADLVTVRDGKIVSCLQFCDTALAARFLGG